MPHPCSAGFEAQRERMLAAAAQLFASSAVKAGQRRVVAAFANAIALMRPGLRGAKLQTPLAMLLFGMISWTFTVLRDGGELTHAAVAPLVVRLFLGGPPAVQVR